MAGLPSGPARLRSPANPFPGLGSDCIALYTASLAAIRAAACPVGSGRLARYSRSRSEKKRVIAWSPLFASRPYPLQVHEIDSHPDHRHWWDHQNSARPGTVRHGRYPPRTRPRYVATAEHRQRSGARGARWAGATPSPDRSRPSTVLFRPGPGHQGQPGRLEPASGGGQSPLPLLVSGPTPGPAAAARGRSAPGHPAR